MNIVGKEHNGSYGSGRFCNLQCKNKYNYIKARKQLSINRKESAIKKQEELNNSEHICELCKKTYILKNGFSERFCSSHCSKKYSVLKNNDIRSNKISQSLRKLPLHKFCNDCGKEIARKNKSGLCRSCANKHKSIFYKLSPDDKNYEHYKYLKYRSECNFNFSLSDYPDEFDFSLIKQYGFYSPTNKKNNLNGVSRDHMYSVCEGYKNNVSPKIISHPANCKLLRHTDNISKNKKSSITLEELLERIKEWEIKYGKYE